MKTQPCLLLILAFAASAGAQDVFVPSDNPHARQSRKASAKVSAEFVAHVGPQRPWETTPIPKIFKGYAVPVYYGRVDRAHDVLGYIYVYEKPSGSRPQIHALDSAAAAAKSHGADALVVHPDKPGTDSRYYLRSAAVKWKREKL